jgi:hypothetical protein
VAAGLPRRGLHLLRPQEVCKGPDLITPDLITDDEEEGDEDDKDFIVSDDTEDSG